MLTFKTLVEYYSIAILEMNKDAEDGDYLSKL